MALPTNSSLRVRGTFFYLLDRDRRSPWPQAQLRANIGCYWHLVEFQVNSTFINIFIDKKGDVSNTYLPATSIYLSIIHCIYFNEV